MHKMFSPEWFYDDCEIVMERRVGVAGCAANPAFALSSAKTNGAAMKVAAPF